MTSEPVRPPASEEEGAGYASPRMDMIAAIALVALTLWYCLTALGFRSPGGWHTSPGLVPIAAGASLGVMAIGLGLSAFRRRGEPRRQLADDDETNLDPRLTGAIIAIVVTYGLALQFLSMPVSATIGGRFLEVGIFEVSTILCLAALMRLFWTGPLWIIAAVSVGWTLLLGLVFRIVFFVSLPV